MRGATPSLELAAALVLAAVLVGVATVSAPYFVSAAGTSLLDAELTASGDRVVLVRVSTASDAHPDAIADADAALRAELAELDLPDPELQVVAQSSALQVDGQRRDGVNLIGRPGGDEEFPDALEGGDGRFATPESSAQRLGITPASEVEIAGPTGTADADLGPILEELEPGAVPAFWQPVSALLTIDDDPRSMPPPPALIGDTDDVLDILARVDAGDGPGDGSDPGEAPALDDEASDVAADASDAPAPATLAATWEVLPEDVPTLEGAQALLPRVEQVRQAVVDPSSELGGALAPASQGRTSGGQPITTGQLGAAVSGTEAATSALAVPVTALGIGGQLLGLVGVGVATVLGGRRGLARSRLWMVRGVSAARLGARWGLTAVVPVAAGAAAGWGLADVLTVGFGPGSGVDPSVRVGVWRDLVLIGVVAVALVTVVAGLASASAGRERATPRRMPAVGEAAAVVVAGVALWQVDTGGGPVTVRTDGTVDLDLLAVALPLLLVVAAAAVGARLLRLVLQRAPGAGTAWFLASRRLRALGGARLGLVFLTATALGVLVTAVTLGQTADATVEEKAGVLVGADASVQLSRSVSQLETDQLDRVAGPVTMVRRVPEALLGGEVEAEILAVDPTTFADVAYDPSGLSEDDVAALTGALANDDSVADGAAVAGGGAGAGDAAVADGAAVAGGGAGADGDPSLTPAIVAGAQLNRPTTLQVQDVTIEVRQTAAVSVFPGMSGEQPLVVIPDGGALDGDDDASAARMATSIWPELWIGGDPDPDALATQLAAADIEGDVTFASEVRQAPGLAPVRWTFAYLQGQATVIAAVGLVALLAYHVVNQRRRALATVLARRMGLTRRARVVADVTELGILLGLAAVVGGGSGLFAARLVFTDYDPMPDVAVPAVFAAPAQLAPVVGVAAVTSLAVAVALAVRVTDRIDVSTLLRGDV